MALIDHGRVMADYLENLGRKDSYKAKFEALCKAVDEAPAVDAVPVVHARWESLRIPSRYGGCVVECSKCYNRGNRSFSYCQVCGAKMDGGAADG